MAKIRIGIIGAVTSPEFMPACSRATNAFNSQPCTMLIRNAAERLAGSAQRHRRCHATRSYSKDATPSISPLQTRNTFRSRSLQSRPANTSFVKSHSRPMSPTRKEFSRKQASAASFRWATIVASLRSTRH
jgi:hypothetical protein